MVSGDGHDQIQGPAGGGESAHTVVQRHALPNCCWRLLHDVHSAIVSSTDLFLGDGVVEVLEAHLEASERFRGIRQTTAWDEDESIRYPGDAMHAGMMLEAKFQEGFARLGPLGLSFDAWLFHPQIPDLTALARTFPETPIVLGIWCSWWRSYPSA